MNEAELDGIFHALADPTRRAIYRELRAQPGLTTGQLAEATRGMTRWGVMKHLGVLRSASLVHTLHDGRRRRHYADPAALVEARRWLGEAGAG
jgi:DNA-binding transcriptional ArsR family regulator